MRGIGMRQQRHTPRCRRHTACCAPGVNAASSPSDASARERAPLAAAPARRATALLVIDMISAWDFPDAGTLAPRALRIAPRIAALKARCRLAGVPVIYANDNRGRWRSDFSALVDLSMAGGGLGATVTAGLAPDHDDYFVLKPQQSAFVATPLEQLLGVLQARRLIVSGVASDQCVLSTASDARMRGFEVVLPKDCTATQTDRRHAMLLEQCDTVFGIATTPGSRIRLPAGRVRHDDLDRLRGKALGVRHIERECRDRETQREQTILHVVPAVVCESSCSSVRPA